jgi:hypothetical protein
MLGLQSADTLHLSSVTDFHAVHDSREVDRQARMRALNKLSFFIAHSLLHLPDPMPPSTPAAAPILNPSVLQQNTIYAPGTSSSHARSDSAQTTRPGNQGSQGDGGSTRRRLAQQVLMLTFSILSLCLY